MKVLIVDDDLISQLVLKRTLEQSGHEVILTRSGTEALKAFQDDAISVVISDWRMPEMDGVELCQTIRSVRKMNYTYFILVSSTRLTPEKYAHAVGMGVDDFLLKPLNRDEVPVRLLVAERIINFTSEIKRLKTLLPICMYCKKIRDDGNYWQQIESYIREATGSNFSHGICPDCYTKIVEPDLNRALDSIQGAKA